MMLFLMSRAEEEEDDITPQIAGGVHLPCDTVHNIHGEERVILFPLSKEVYTPL